MGDEKYLLELEDKIESGVVELLMSEMGPILAANMWQSLGLVPQLCAFLQGLPKHALVGRLPKSDGLYHKIQPDSDVDILAFPCEVDAEGQVTWPPQPRQLAAVEVKAAYALVKSQGESASLVVYGLNDRKLKKAATQCESLMLMEFDHVSLLVGIATEPQGGLGSQPWTNASIVGAEAFFKARPFLKSMPPTQFGIAAWSIGAVAGPLGFVPRNEIPKGKHPLRVNPSRAVDFRKTEKFAGAGSAQLVRVPSNNNLMNERSTKKLKDNIESISKSLTAWTYLGISTFMLRLRDDQWERIREHFPEEHSPEG
ncbi:MAG: hypothetical protein AB1555_19025, partial [Nitrospirota bacterium]